MCLPAVPARHQPDHPQRNAGVLTSINYVLCTSCMVALKSFSYTLGISWEFGPLSVMLNVITWKSRLQRGSGDSLEEPTTARIG